MDSSGIELRTFCSMRGCSTTELRPTELRPTERENFVRAEINKTQNVQECLKTLE